MKRAPVLILMVFLVLFATDVCAMPDLPSEVNFAGMQIDIENSTIKMRVEREVLSFLDHPYKSSFLALQTGTYLRFFEEEIKEHGLPEDLRYLPIVESELNGIARSRKGAAGFWQLMPATARRMNLEITNCVDERYDMKKSTAAAARLLHSLVDIFDGDWLLALAAYNTGEGDIIVATREQKEKDFWHLFLDEETARFVPRIIAVKLVFNNPETYLKVPVARLYEQHAIDTEIETLSKPTHVNDLAKKYGMSVYEFRRIYNAHIRGCQLLPKGRYNIYKPSNQTKELAHE